MNRCLQLAGIAVACATIAANAQATNVFWVGGTGNLLDSNYSDGVTTGLPPQEADILFLGNNGTITHDNGIGLFQKVRVGHDLASPGGVGPATLTVNNGAQLNLTSAGGGADASVIIGAGANIAGSGASGTLNIDGAGSKVTSAQLVQIGFGGNASASATVNITNGGALTTTTGNINLGERAGNLTTGIPGNLNISGAGSSITITVNNASLNVGVRAGSTYTQTDGTVSVGGVNIGQNTAHNSSMSITGGTFATKPSQPILVGTNTSQNASLVVGGTAVLNLGSNITVGDTSAKNPSLTVSGTADINIPGTAAAGNIFIGRGATDGASFTMTGGTIDLGNHFLMGSSSSPGATNIVGTHSNGTITTTNNFVLADTFGSSTYNLSDTGIINANGLVIVGRQSATAVMNQTGGTVTATLGVNVGNAQNATTTLWGTGTYDVSAGTITTGLPGGITTTLSIAPQGTGTFRVSGDDATINVNGNAVVNAGGGAQGTLAYRLETGDLLSQINVTGTATFNVGAILNFDTSQASPTQTAYNLLTAADVIDSGLVFSGPTGWSFDIIPGGNGEILRAVQTPVGVTGDFNSDGKVDAGDYATWRKNEIANVALANDNGVGNQAARFTLWQANFGNPPGSGSGLSGASVPEPTTFGLVALGLFALATTRRVNRICRDN